MMNMRSNESRAGAAAGGWLHLAATPAFVAMAAVTAVAGSDPAHILCQAMGHGWLSLDGMSFMYLLMAAFHASPWWKWIALRVPSHTRTKRICASKTTATESR